MVALIQTFKNCGSFPLLAKFGRQTRNMSRLVYKSAVVVSPPSALWGPIQEIRKKHDKAYHRWMPHINLYLLLVATTPLKL